MIFEPVFLKIINFMNHSYSEIDFNSFNSCLIIGKDKDNNRKSNGVGKSTIFHAIDYVLFDQVPTKTIDKVVRDGQDKCEVSFEFLLDTKKYRLTRKRSNKSNKSEILLEEYDSDEWKKTDHRTKTDTEKAVKDLLKINYESFKNSVLFSQGAFSDLAEGTDSQKRAVLKEPLDLNIYSKYEKVAKKKLSSIESELNSIKSLIASIGDPESDIRDSKIKIESLKRSIKEDEEKRILIKESIEKNRDIINDFNKLLNSDDVKISEELVSISKAKSKLSSSISDLNLKLISNSKNLDTIKKKIADCKNKEKELENSLMSLKDIKFESEDVINSKLQEISDKEKKGNKYIAYLENEIEKYKKPLPEGSVCEVCFNELTDDYREKISKTHGEKLIDSKIEFEKSNSKMKSLLTQKNELYSQLKELANNQVKINGVINSIQSNIKDIENNESLLDKYRKINEDISGEISVKERELNDLLSRENSLKDHSKDINTNDINQKILHHNNIIIESEREDSFLVRKVNQSNMSLGESLNFEKTRQLDLKKLSELQDNKCKIESKHTVYSKAAKAFSSSGIPMMIIHTILDDLQIEANNILNEIRPELSLQFAVEKDDKDILDIIYKLNGKERDYKQLSGGQKTYLSFALKLGLSMVIQKRMGINFKFLELDEVDQALDEDGKDTYVEIIKKFQDKYKILVITHDARLQNKFQYIMCVENDPDNGATVNMIGS